MEQKMTEKEKTSPSPIHVARKCVLALSFLTAVAFAQEAPPQTVRQLDALEFSSIASAASNIPQPQIRTLWQSQSDRVPPHAIALPAWTGAALPAAASVAATAGLLTWTQTADGGLRAAISVQSPGAKGLRLGLLVDQLPPSAQLRVYAPGAAETTKVAAAQAMQVRFVRAAA
jgi:hypothetical protein